MDVQTDPDRARHRVTAWLKQGSTRSLVLAFSAYSWIVTSVCAALFIVQRSPAGIGRAEFGQALLWQAAVFGVWLPAGGLVWLLVRRFEGGRLLAAMGLTMLAVAPLAAFAGTAIDLVATGHDWSQWPSRAVDRGPVAILLWTAVCAVGLAAAQQTRAVAARAETMQLHIALAHARRSAADSLPQRLLVSVGRGRAPVDVSTIERLEGAANYAVVHFDGREGLIRETMKSLEDRLDPAVFVRVHRSALINLARVVQAQPLADGAWRVTMSSGAEVVVSRSYRDDLLARLTPPEAEASR